MCSQDLKSALALVQSKIINTDKDQSHSMLEPLIK